MRAETKAGRIAVGMLLAAVLMAPHGAAAAGPTYAPADLDYAAHCLVNERPAVALDRDWTQWSVDTPVDTPVPELLEIANEYLRGSDRVPASRETAMRILRHVEATGGVPQPRLDRLIGKALLTGAEDSATLDEGIARLESALAGGVGRAAFDLAEAFAPGGPSQLRDAAKARDYYRIAAASGDVDGQLGYARVIAADPNIGEAEKAAATNNALLGMIQRIAEGQCMYMPTIGFMYLRGELVAQDYDNAVRWLEQYAETGDARVQERLGQLLTSSHVSEIRIDLAMDYMEAAALQGRPFAALTVGKAKATGVGDVQDMAAAESFLKLAADAGLKEARHYLARLYEGEFGGEPRPELAKEQYELALAGGMEPEIAALYGELLIADVSGIADPDRAIRLLEGAAAGGSGRAAVAVGKLFLKLGANDTAYYEKAEQYFRLAAELGKPEGARELAKMYACGTGVPLSIEEANEWNERAFSLGSGSALYSVGLEFLVDADPAVQAHGRTLLKQAALKGYPSAIGYAIAHYETGKDGLPRDPAAAERLLAFVANSDDATFRLDATLQTIKARMRLDPTPEEAADQFALLDTLIADGAADASMLKAELLDDTGAADPGELMALYEVAANAGNPRAMREYALLLLADPGIEVAVGRDWLARAAAAGDMKAKILEIDVTANDALPLLERLVATHRICTVDEMVSVARAFAGVIDTSGTEQARFWLTTAAEVAGKDADDLFKIGDAYRDGIAGIDHVADAEAFFVEAADLGRQTALRELADGHLLGLWKDASPGRAKSLLMDLFADGDRAAGAKLIAAAADGDVAITIDEVEMLLAGLPEADASGLTYLKLARLDETGAFGAAHPEKRVEWLRLSADGGNPNAMIRLYRAYASGVGVPLDPDAAVDWLMRAADAGDPRAAIELAAAYEVGFGVSANAEQAAFWRAQAEGVPE